MTKKSPEKNWLHPR